MRHIYMNTLYDYEGDAALVMRVLAGNREAFNILASRYYVSVLRLCVRLLSDPIEAQDVAQETILQAFLGLNRLQQPARFGAWLHAIAGNLARSALRRQRPVSFEALDEIERPGLERAALFPNLEQVVAMRETHDTIVAALMELSIVNRKAVIGYYLQGYSYAELASLLGVPTSTVKSRLFKGRQQLRESLEHLIHPEPLSPVLERKETTMSLPEHVGLQVEMICEYSLTQRSIVVLGALSGNQYLPIRMLTDEALTVERALKSRLDNPLVTGQDPLLQLMVKLGGRIEQVILRSLVKQNYYASLIVAVDGQHHEVDCRLSDALALAIRAQIPVQIAPALLDEAGITMEYMDIDPAVAEAELPDLPELMTTSDQWPHSFVENVWSFLLGVLYRNRKPHDLSRLRGLAWNELFPTQEANWDGQRMQFVRLPASESAWLVVRPELWGQLSRFVEWIQHRDISHLAEPQTPLGPLVADQKSQVEELLEQEWPTLIDLGARTLALVHLSGRLISWKSLDNYEAAVRMGRAAMKDLSLARHFNALVDAVAEPSVKITYERSTTFNPAQAAGTNVSSTCEALIHNAWLLVIGLTSDQNQREAQSQLARVQQSLAALLPS